MATILNQDFWNKLSQISSDVGMSPEDLMAVMYYESGLNPGAHNKNGDASGLIQFMPKTLEGLGYKGTHSDFRQLDVNKQLDYVEKYVKNQAAFNGGGFKSAAQYYVANLWPVALKLPGVQSEDPNTVILDSNPTTQRYPGVSLEYEKRAYKDNAGLDVDRNGKITYGDLQKVMAQAKRSPVVQNAISSLNSGQAYAVNNNQKPQQPGNSQMPSQDKLDELNTYLDQFLGALAGTQHDGQLIKKAVYKQFLPKNNILIKVKSSNFVNSLEFARILCLALDEEVLADAFIHTDRKNVEIFCSIHGPEKTCLAAVNQLCKSVGLAFKEATIKIGGLEIKTTVLPNTMPDYQELDIKLAQTAYRQFHLKFIK